MSSIQRKCAVDDCEHKSRYLNYCEKHAYRFKKYGDPLIVKPTGTIHGMTGTLVHTSYRGMIDRCYRKSHIFYHHYGGRGITVCDRWRGKNGFHNFFADMGDRPSRKHSIDRINNDGNYEPDNCRWATQSYQIVNSRDFRINKSGFKGVYKSGNRWIAQFRRKHLGNFTTPEAAAQAYSTAKKDYLQAAGTVTSRAVVLEAANDLI